MCTILLAWRVVPGAPVVLAANRDELLARPSLAPHVLRIAPLVAGGQDVVAGGTWLAVRQDGVVAAVTNRRSGERDPSRRSRGELPMALLDTTDDQAARALMEAIVPADYNPFNALHVSAMAATVAMVHGAGLQVVPLAPGLHVLTVDDLDDRARPKVAALSDRFAALPDDDPATLLAGMEEVLRDHGEPGREGVDAACVHGELYGTVSSSSVVVHDDGRILYRHAPGRPCVTAHGDVSALLEDGAQLSLSG